MKGFFKNIAVAAIAVWLLLVDAFHYIKGKICGNKR